MIGLSMTHEVLCSKGEMLVPFRGDVGYLHIWKVVRWVFVPKILMTSTFKFDCPNVLVYQIETLF